MIENRAVEEIRSKIMLTVEAFFDSDDTVYGDVPLKTPAEKAAFILDLKQRGILDILQTVSAKHAADLEREYDQAVAKIRSA